MALSENRQKFDKQMQEKLKILQRCENLEAKVLLLQSISQPSDGSKPTVQNRNSSLVDKLKASNAIAQAVGGQQKRLQVINFKKKSISAIKQ